MSQPAGVDAPAAATPALRASARLHVVTGKGGTGKTTVSAAMAIALASSGKRVLLVEVEERQGLAQVLDVPPLSYEERHVVTTPGGGEVLALAVDPHEALMEYLALYYKVRRAGKALERIGAVDFATTVAPGLRDVLLTGKVYEAVRRRVDERFVYDAVVLDAPPTGRITRFLGVSTDVAGLAKVGPINRHAQAITHLFRSPRTAVHIVTLAEEMPAEETTQAVKDLWRARFPVGAIIVNGSHRPMLRFKELVALREADLGVPEVAEELARVGVDDPAEAEALVDQGIDYAVRVMLDRRARRVLERLDRPTLSLPLLDRGVDVAGVHQLATALRTQGVA